MNYANNLGFSGNYQPDFNMGSMPTPGQAANNPYLGQNPYLQQNIDYALDDITKQYQLGTAPQMATANVNSGSFGNSGLQQMQQEQQRQFGSTLGRTDAAMRMQDYGNQQGMYQWDQGFNRNLFNDSVAQNQQNLQNFQGLLSTGNQLNTQDLNSATSIYNTPMNYASQFGNQANGYASGFATETGSKFMPGSPIFGALGGWQLGSEIGNAFGKQNWGTALQYGTTPGSQQTSMLADQERGM